MKIVLNVPKPRWDFGWSMFVFLGDVRPINDTKMSIEQRIFALLTLVEKLTPALGLDLHPPHQIKTHHVWWHNKA